MTSYRPIKTAPRDGTWILIRGRNSVGEPMVPMVVSWRMGEGRATNIAWRESSILCEVSEHKNMEWAPLPD